MVASRPTVKVEHIAFVTLLLSWLNPLHVGPWISLHNEALAFTAGAILFLRVLRGSHVSSAPIYLPPSAMLWPALALVVLLQYSLDQIEYSGDVATLIFYLALVLLAHTGGFFLERNNKTTAGNDLLLLPLAVVISLGASLSAFIAFAQSLDVWTQSEWISRAYSLRRPGANIAQPNQLATLQLMGIVSLNYLFGLGRLRGLAALFLFVLLVAGLGLTESRSGVLGAAVLVAFFILHRNRAMTGQPVWYALAGFALLIASFKYLPLFSFYLQQVGMADQAQQAANLSAGSRLVIWPQLIEASFQHPWLGWGLRQVPMAHNAVLHQYSVGEAFTYAHNIVLDLVLGAGYPLSIAAVGLFAYWIVKRLRKIEDSSAWYCMALLIPLVVHSLLEFPFAYAYFLVPVALAVGVLEARLFPDKYIEIKWVYACVGYVLFVLVLLWSVWEYIQIEEDFRVARFEALRIGKTPASYDRPNILLLTQLDAMLTGIRLVPEPGMSEERIDEARKVAMRFPWIATQNRYALTLALNGNADEAVRQLKVMRAMHGEKTYQGIKSSWGELSNTKYPQLKDIPMP